MSERQSLLTLSAAHVAHTLATNALSAFTPAELVAAAKRDDLDAATREAICNRLALVGAHAERQEVHALPAPHCQSAQTATGWSSGSWGGGTWGSSASK